MQRILRGDLRFSCGGFTYLRIASRLCASAPSETSAHTGRRTSLRELFCVPALGFPNNLLSIIDVASAHRETGCRAIQTTLLPYTPEPHPIHPLPSPITT